MRKFGYFFAAFLPILAAIGIQLIASFFLLGVAGLCSILSGNGFSYLMITELTADNNFNYVLMLIYALISIVTFGLWYYKSCGGDFLPRPSETFSGLQLLGVVVIIPGAQFASSLLMGILSMLAPSWLEQYEELIESAGLDSSLSLPMICYAVVLAPICEELIFRGVTLRLAGQSLPFWLANLMQAGLFGAFHMNWMQGCYAFALGVLLGFVCEKGGSIYYSILLHILFNVWGTIISPLISDTDNPLLLGVIILLTMVISLGLGLLFFILGMKRRNERNALRKTQSAPA